MWDEAVKAAEKEGILVIDCTNNNQGFIIASYFSNTNRKESPKDLSIGFASIENNTDYEQAKSIKPNINNCVAVPTSPRTVAEEYYEGIYGYTYCGEGGLSWSIPYAAGVFALGWQVNPNLSAEEIKRIFIDSAYLSEDGFKYIDPVNFIKQVKSTL